MEANTRLVDNFHVCGTEMEQFRGENEAMASITKELDVKSFEIEFLSYSDSDAAEDKTKFYILSHDRIDAFLKDPVLSKQGKIDNYRFGSADILDEMKNTTGLCALINGKLYIVSPFALPTFTLRAEVKGDKTISRNNLIRNLHLADALYSKDERIHLVYREEEVNGVTVRKIFAGLGSLYKLIPQTIVTQTIDELTADGIVGTPALSRFEIDHSYTTAEVSLPDVGKEIAEEYKIDANIVPGLYLSTSDIGASSVIIRGIYKKGHSSIITDEVKIMHAGSSLTPEKILEEADKKIFGKIRKLPETLAELMGREIIDYSKVDLSDPDHAEKNYTAVYEILKKEIKAIAKEANVSGKKTTELLDCMAAEINSSLRYTLYDIAVDFMSVPSRITGLDRDTVARLQKACGQTPYRLAKLTLSVGEEEEIALTPA
ncbi:MAG: hypothetical protein K6G10_06850 [Butyrivibrio sp.]|nr:hypothetical protein [Butyrivibrio sp.]